MGFKNKANRISAEKGRELSLIASMEYTGRVYRIHDPVLGSHIVSSDSHSLSSARQRGYDIDEVRSESKLDTELKHFSYKEKVDSATDIISADVFDRRS